MNKQMFQEVLMDTRPWSAQKSSGNFTLVVDTGGTPQGAGDVTVVPEEVRAVGQFVADIARNLGAGIDSASTEADALLADG
jgi:hypothetical protein